jgi:hypothetical protein
MLAMNAGGLPAKFPWSILEDVFTSASWISENLADGTSSRCGCERGSEFEHHPAECS